MADLPRPDVVSLEAIPYALSEQAHRRLGPKRIKIQKKIIEAYAAFQEAANEIHWVNVKSVEFCKEKLETLIDACKAYKKNLHW